MYKKQYLIWDISFIHGHPSSKPIRSFSLLSRFYLFAPTQILFTGKFAFIIYKNENHHSLSINKHTKKTKNNWYKPASFLASSISSCSLKFKWAAMQNVCLQFPLFWKASNAVWKAPLWARTDKASKTWSFSSWMVSHSFRNIWSTNQNKVYKIELVS